MHPAMVHYGLAKIVQATRQCSRRPTTINPNTSRTDPHGRKATQILLDQQAIHVPWKPGNVGTRSKSHATRTVNQPEVLP